MPALKRDMKQTEKLCNASFDPQNPKSPRCVVPVTQHAGKPHRAIRPDGTIVEWGQT